MSRGAPASSSTRSARQGFNEAPQEAREQIIHAFADSSPEALAGVTSLRGATMSIQYALPDLGTGLNPNWTAMGYPGPARSSRAGLQTASHAARGRRDDDRGRRCDHRLGRRGRRHRGRAREAGSRSAIVEMGGYFNEADFNRSELGVYSACTSTVRRPSATADQEFSLMAGSCLGAGPLSTGPTRCALHPWVRQQWAREHGLDRRRQRRLRRHSTACGSADGQRRLLAPQRAASAARRVRHSGSTTRAATPTPRPTITRARRLHGLRRRRRLEAGTFKTYLADAPGGADLVVQCRVDKVWSRNGRAAGVEGTYTGADGSTTTSWCTPQRGGRRRARSAGAAAALGHRRPGGGGLRAASDECHQRSLHEPDPWLRRTAQAARCRTSSPTSTATASWWPAPQHGRVRRGGDLGVGAPAQGGDAELPARDTFINLTRDRGEGQVVIDAAGNAVPAYPLTDELDIRHIRRGLAEMIRMHDAAGAERIGALKRQEPGIRGARRRPRRVCREREPGPVDALRVRAVLGPPDGDVPDGHRPGRQRRRAVRRTARRQGRVDRRRERIPDLVGGQPDDDDHGARPPHLRGDRSGVNEGLTVAVTGPTGDIGRAAVRALEQAPEVERVVGMARRPFDPADLGWEHASTARATCWTAVSWTLSSRAPTWSSTLAFIILGDDDETHEDEPARVTQRLRGGARGGRLAAGLHVVGSRLRFHPDNPQPLTRTSARADQSFYYSAQKAKLEGLLRSS